LPQTANKTLNQIRDLPRTRAPLDVLAWAESRYRGNIALATSLGPGSLAIIDMLAELGRDIPVFLLDTGFLFQATHELKARIEARYGIEIEPIRPALSVEEQAERHGPRLWERSADHCCAMRKVEPLSRALHGLDAWITGLRRDQGPGRAGIETVEWDHSHELMKINPLAWWSRDELFDLLRTREVPYNPLLDDGYRSIGCQPCTRRVADADDPTDERAGRWSGTAKTECGIHLVKTTPSTDLPQE
jgi:phosphoadenosine phosphosulfate reductase